MEAMRQSWTDDRMDDLSRRVEARFDQVDRRFEHADQRLDLNTHELRSETRELRTEMSMRFDRVDERLDGMQRTMIHGVIALSGSMLAGFCAIVAVLIAQS
jgi:phosphoglycerate-specific signal transduction histidine kinase